jgi:hypothetical protein
MAPLTLAPVTSTSFSLETTQNDNNGADGNFFDLQATNGDIQITGFDINIKDAGVTFTAEIYSREGSYQGHETSLAGWTKHDTITSVSPGSGALSPLVLSNPILISAGVSNGMRAFYVTLINSANTGIRYTNGSGEGNLFVQDSHLSFYEGRGSKGIIGSSISTFVPRIFNGIIHYQLPTSGPPTPVPTVAPPVPSPTPAPLIELMTTMQGGNTQAGNFFNIEAKNPISISGFVIHARSGTYTVEVFTRDGPYADDMTNAGGSWQKIQTLSGLVGNGETFLTPLPLLSQPINVLPSDGMRAFYVKLDTANIKYTNGPNGEGQKYAEDSNIIFYEGRGVSGTFGGTFSPRVFNGKIIYSVIP